MLDSFSERQRHLLRELHANKTGLTIDDLAGRLGVTRTAVKQHLVSLEQGGFVERGPLKALARGRPGRSYRLSERGIELFPKQYSWFSELLLAALKAEEGSDKLADRLSALGRAVAQSLLPRVEGLPSAADRAEVIARIMNELSFEAAVEPGAEGAAPAIVARNCIYHHLAARFPEVCALDLELLAQLSGAPVEHQECLIRGGSVCRFRLRGEGSGGR